MTVAAVRRRATPCFMPQGRPCPETSAHPAILQGPCKPRCKAAADGGVMRSSSPRPRRIGEVPSAELALFARGGDRDALAELYRRAWPRALAAVRSTSGWDEAEDAVAEGFVR